MKLVVNSAESLSQAIGTLRSEYAAHRFVRVTLVSGKHRSVQINALSHAWYQQVSLERGEMTPGQVKAFCKLHFGVPILRRDSEEFKATYDSCLKSLPYETKLSVVAMIPITSALTTNQMKEYLEEVKAHFEALPVDPVALEWPEGE